METTNKTELLTELEFTRNIMGEMVKHFSCISYHGFEEMEKILKKEMENYTISKKF